MVLDNEENIEEITDELPASLRHETSYMFYSDHMLDSVKTFEKRPYNSYQEFR